MYYIKSDVKCTNVWPYDIHTTFIFSPDTIYSFLVASEKKEALSANSVRRPGFPGIPHPGNAGPGVISDH